MKFSKFMTVIGLMLAVLCTTTSAQLTAWSGGGTLVSTNTSYAVVSANGAAGTTPVLTYLNATSEKATSKVQFYQITNAPLAVTVTNSTVNLYVARTNGYVSGDIIIIQHKANDNYERRVLTTSLASTNLVVTVAPTQVTVPGDIIYRAATAGSIPVGATTKELSGPGLYSGQAGKPLLFEVDGTNAPSINAAAARFIL